MSQTQTDSPPQDKRDRPEDTLTVTEFESEFEDATTFGDRITELAKLELANLDGSDELRPDVLGIDMEVEWVHRVLKSPLDDNAKLLREEYHRCQERLNNAMALVEHLQANMANLDGFIDAADEEECHLTARDVISLLLILGFVLPKFARLADEIYKLPRF
ncbi:hypothetical protein FCIRC_12694 [Fusarium circinatum]|uniref:Uncharacterized protein n=1 Tax=Fusarium circinatum TaxID=48490 RepID=A0A8H5WHQ0_FUSCI|nr:hypothetical protein FCIRC_12694 [Fusarium circinatum]